MRVAHSPDTHPPTLAQKKAPADAACRHSNRSPTLWGAAPALFDVPLVTVVLLLFFPPPPADAPTCATHQQRVYGVAKQEQAQIKCIVDANPSDVEFKWTFNNSAESIDVANNHVTRSGMFRCCYYNITNADG